jgi:2-dehydropantoate 2-reductase
VEEKRMTTPLRFLIFGAGAVGTYIGGSLALQEYPVVFIERPEVAENLIRRGLRLQLKDMEYTLPQVQVAVTLEEALGRGPFDVALFALKAYDTGPVLESFTPFASQLPPVLCLQNGVENEPAIEAALGPGKAIYGTLTSAVGRRAAGDIVLERLRGMGVAAGHPLSERLVDSLSAAGLNARLYPEAGSMKWSKMLTNLLSNAASAILDMTPSEVFSHPGLFRLELAQLRETLAVMRRLNLSPVDLPGTPVRLLAFGVRSLPPNLSRPLLRRAVGRGRGGKMPSFHIDLHAGRGKSEVGYLNGAVYRYASRLGLPAPANAVLTETLLSLTRGELSLQAFARKPEKLLALFEERRSAPGRTPSAPTEPGEW